MNRKSRVRSPSISSSLSPLSRNFDKTIDSQDDDQDDLSLTQRGVEENEQDPHRERRNVVDAADALDKSPWKDMYKDSMVEKIEEWVDDKIQRSRPQIGIEEILSELKKANACLLSVRERVNILEHELHHHINQITSGGGQSPVSVHHSRMFTPESISSGKKRKTPPPVPQTYVSGKHMRILPPEDDDDDDDDDDKPQYQYQVKKKKKSRVLDLVDDRDERHFSNPVDAQNSRRHSGSNSGWLSKDDWLQLDSVVKEDLVVLKGEKNLREIGRLLLGKAVVRKSCEYHIRKSIGYEQMMVGKSHLLEVVRCAVNILGSQKDRLADDAIVVYFPWNHNVKVYSPNSDILSAPDNQHKYIVLGKLVDIPYHQ